MNFNKKYAEYYDLFNSGKDYSKECDFLELVFKKYSKKPVKSIFDLGCGTGLHDGELSKRGYRITGLDLSREMIDIARGRNPNDEFIVGDMSNFNLNQKFDAVICMFSAMGYLTKNRQIESFFSSVKNHLNIGDLIILDVWNGLGVMNELPTSREKIAKMENLRIVRKSFPDLDSKNHINNVKFLVKVFEKKKLIDEYEENHKVRFFFPQELRKYAEDAGFEILHLCPSFDFDKKVTEKDWNIVLVARLKN